MFSAFICAVGGGPNCVMVKELDCRIVISKFKVQLCYYVHFRTNIFGKVMRLLIHLAMGKIVPLFF